MIQNYFSVLYFPPDVSNPTSEKTDAQPASPSNDKNNNNDNNNNIDAPLQLQTPITIENFKNKSPHSKKCKSKTKENKTSEIEFSDFSSISSSSTLSSSSSSSSSPSTTSFTSPPSSPSSSSSSPQSCGNTVSGRRKSVEKKNPYEVKLRNFTLSKKVKDKISSWENEMVSKLQIPSHFGEKKSHFGIVDLNYNQLGSNSQNMNQNYNQQTRHSIANVGEHNNLIPVHPSNQLLNHSSSSIYPNVKSSSFTNNNQFQNRSNHNLSSSSLYQLTPNLDLSNPMMTSSGSYLRSSFSLRPTSRSSSSPHSLCIPKSPLLHVLNEQFPDFRSSNLNSPQNKALSRHCDRNYNEDIEGRNSSKEIRHPSNHRTNNSKNSNPGHDGGDGDVDTVIVNIENRVIDTKQMMINNAYNNQNSEHVKANHSSLSSSSSSSSCQPLFVNNNQQTGDDEKKMKINFLLNQ